MQVVNATYALWTWHRNQDIYKENSSGDQIYVVRQPELCLGGSKVGFSVKDRSKVASKYQCEL